MKKMFLEKLPRKRGFGANKNKLIIDWLNSVGYKVRFIYDDVEGYIEIVGYDPKGQILTIKYEDKDPFKTLTGSFQKCQLGRLLGTYTGEFKIEIGDTFKDDKRDIVITDRKYIKDINGHKWRVYKYKCNKCGFECGEHYKNGEYKEDYWIVEHSLLQETGCACCCPAPKIIVPHINSIVANEETHWMIKYFQGGYNEAKRYTYRSNNRIKPICDCCGKIKEKSILISNIYADKSIGCTCGDGFSYGHKYIFNMLTQLNLNFVENKRFDWCNFHNYKDENKQTYGEYDFVIEDKKLIIEVDGDFHRKDNGMSGQSKEESVYLDDTKDLKAHENGYRVIRISDEDSIRDNILESELNNLFDLCEIDWYKCEEFALSNRVKKICELKRNNPSLTVADIHEKTKLGRTTIKRYLNKGAKLGWCNYDPKEEQRKSGKLFCKKVEVFKDGVSLGIFEGVRELARQSEKLFGIKLNNNRISDVCLGKQPYYKGFTFKYI